MNIKAFFHSFLKMAVRIILFAAANTAVALLYSLIVRRLNVVDISNALTVIGFLYIAVGGFPLLKEVFPSKKSFSFGHKVQHAYDDKFEMKDPYGQDNEKDITETDDKNFKFALKVISYGLATMAVAWAILLF